MPSISLATVLSVPLLASFLTARAFTIPSAADGYEENSIKDAAEGYWEMAKRGIVDAGQVADSYGAFSLTEPEGFVGMVSLITDVFVTLGVSPVFFFSFFLFGLEDFVICGGGLAG